MTSEDLLGDMYVAARAHADALVELHAKLDASAEVALAAARATQDVADATKFASVTVDSLYRALAALGAADIIVIPQTLESED